MAGATKGRVSTTCRSEVGSIGQDLGTVQPKIRRHPSKSDNGLLSLLLPTYR